MSVVLRVIERQEGAVLLRLKGERHREQIGSKIPRVYTRLSCGCSYLATGDVGEHEEVFCSRHR